MKTSKEVTPMIKAISYKLYNNFKEEFKDLAMDLEDLEQESYLYHLDFEKRFANKFKKDIRWSAIRQYIIWKLMEKIYNWRKKDVFLVSLDTELPYSENGESHGNLERKINEKLMKQKGISMNRKSPLKDKKELCKLLTKLDPEFNLEGIKKVLGDKKFNIFIEVLNDESTQEKIGEKYKVTKQYVGQVYRKSLNKLKLHFYKR